MRPSTLRSRSTVYRETPWPWNQSIRMPLSLVKTKHRSFVRAERRFCKATALHSQNVDGNARKKNDCDARLARFNCGWPSNAWCQRVYFAVGGDLGSDRVAVMQPTKSRHGDDFVAIRRG